MGVSSNMAHLLTSPPGRRELRSELLKHSVVEAAPPQVDEVAPCEYEATLETPLACYDDALLTAAHDALRELGVEPGATRAQTIAAVGALLEEAGLE